MLRITKNHLNGFPKLQGEIKALDLDITANEHPLAVEGKKLAELEKKLALVKVKQIKTVIIPGHETSIRIRKDELKQDSVLLQNAEAELKQATKTLADKLDIVTAWEQRMSRDQALLDKLKSELTRAESHRDQIKQQLDKANSIKAAEVAKRQQDMTEFDIAKLDDIHPKHTHRSSSALLHHHTHAHGDIVSSLFTDISRQHAMSDLASGIRSHIDNEMHLLGVITDLGHNLAAANNVAHMHSETLERAEPILNAAIADAKRKIAAVESRKFQRETDDAEAKVRKIQTKIAKHNQFIDEAKIKIINEIANISRLEEQYGKATPDVEKMDSQDKLTTALASIGEDIAAVKSSIVNLKRPAKDQDEKKWLYQTLSRDEIFQQLIHSPEGLIKSFAEKARKAIDEFEEEEIVISNEKIRLRLIEFRRDIDLICPEDDMSADIEGEFQPGLEEKTKEPAQTRCFQLAGLLYYMHTGEQDDCSENLKQKLANIMAEMHLDERNSEAEFYHFLESKKLALRTTKDLNKIQLKAYNEERNKFLSALMPYAKAINQTKEMKEFYEKMLALFDIPSFKKDSYDIAFTTQVLRTATRRIKKPTDQTIAARLDILSSHIKSEQPNLYGEYWGKVIAFVGAIIALTAIAVITVLTYGVSAPVTVPLVAKIAIDAGIGGGSAVLLTGLGIFRASKATGTTKIINAAKDALNNAPPSFFLKKAKKFQASQEEKHSEHLSTDSPDALDMLSTDAQVFNRGGVEDMFKPSAPALPRSPQR